MSTSLRNSRAVVLAAAAAGLLLLGISLAFYWVPDAPIEGFRQRIFYIHVPIALTAYARTEDRLRSLSAGFDMHVTKPVEPVELLTIVASLTGRLSRPRNLYETGAVAGNMAGDMAG